MADRPLSVAAMRLVDLFMARGHRDLKHYDYMPREEFGEFAAWCNGSGEPRKDGNRTPEVPPYHWYVESRGMPLGLINPYGGTVVGDSEDAIIAAIEAALTPDQLTEGIEL